MRPDDGDWQKIAVDRLKIIFRSFSYYNTVVGAYHYISFLVEAVASRAYKGCKARGINIFLQHAGKYHCGLPDCSPFCPSKT